VPPTAAFLVADRGEEVLPRVAAHGAVPFPRTAGPDAPAQTLLDDVAAAREAGVHFLVVPASAHEWLPAGFTDEVRARHREVLAIDACTIVALQDPPPYTYGATAPDGFPVPPPEQIGLTLGLFDVPGLDQGFVESGAADAQAIRDILRTNGLGVRRLDALLDFGCGCGRVLRHWSNLADTRVHGSDFNPYMIEWCRENLPFAAFSVNEPAPPLEYGDSSFDLVYGVSVFTHLPEPLQLPWLRELVRVTRPGGRLLLSLNGIQQADALLEGAERERFDAGRLATIWAEHVGTNTCTAFHPAPYRRELAAASGLDLVDERPDAICNAGQDLVLLRKPAG
jgi:SAM-dependent methyltransferase